MNFKRLIFNVLFLSLQVAVFAYEVDTTYLHNGVVLYHVTDNALPGESWIMEVDLSNPDVSVEPCFANNKLGRIESHSGGFVSKEVISSMAKRESANADSVIGAVNADFFDITTGIPLNAFVRNGILASTPIASAPHSAISFDDSGRPDISIVEYSGTVNYNGKSFNLTSVNFTRRADNMVCYNSYIGESTLTNPYGTEVLLTPVSNTNYMNCESSYVVNKVQSGVGDMQTNDNQLILSGHGAAETFLKSIPVNSTITLNQEMVKSLNQKIYHLVGGFPQIIKNGINCVSTAVNKEKMSYALYAKRHPRSAVGYNISRTKLYLVVSDGRRDDSPGLTLNELAKLMMDFGVYEALNFDGGGSTALWAGNKIVNKPSDGSERRVANSLLVKVKKSSIITSSEIVKKSLGIDKLYVYPNPAESAINLKFKSNRRYNTTLFIYNMAGTLVKCYTMKIENGENFKEFDVSELIDGYYTCVLGDEGSLKTRFLKK